MAKAVYSRGSERRYRFISLRGVLSCIYEVVLSCIYEVVLLMLCLWRISEYFWNRYTHPEYGVRDCMCTVLYLVLYCA
jgi:hypothetical protein